LACKLDTSDLATSTDLAIFIAHTLCRASCIAFAIVAVLVCWTNIAAFAAIFPIIFDIGAFADTTALIGRAWFIANSTVIAISVSVGASGITYAHIRFAFALTAHTGLIGVTTPVTTATMHRVVIRIDAFPPAIDETHATGTRAIGTGLIAWTSFVTGSTMSLINLEIDASAAAIGLAAQTGFFCTLALFADLFVRADLVTGSTVLAVILQIDATIATSLMISFANTLTILLTSLPLFAITVVFAHWFDYTFVAYTKIPLGRTSRTIGVCLTSIGAILSWDTFAIIAELILRTIAIFCTIGDFGSNTGLFLTRGALIRAMSAISIHLARRWTLRLCCTCAVNAVFLAFGTRLTITIELTGRRTRSGNTTGPCYTSCLACRAICALLIRSTQ
jgi:hypothetical protein